MPMTACKQALLNTGLPAQCPPPGMLQELTPELHHGLVTSLGSLQAQGAPHGWADDDAQAMPTGLQRRLGRQLCAHAALHASLGLAAAPHASRPPTLSAESKYPSQMVLLLYVRPARKRLWPLQTRKREGQEQARRKD